MVRRRKARETMIGRSMRGIRRKASQEKLFDTHFSCRSESVSITIHDRRRRSSVHQQERITASKTERRRRTAANEHNNAEVRCGEREHPGLLKA